ncbi:MAG TPA: oligopeptide/dipeptide ABC transporter ATP-binding protein, partial [Microbacterium sp.]|nr:oligopeptide/dipeptide ABC transporter ATP-binding protein [Microbacterium sp.]
QLAAAQHPYTRALLAAVPDMHTDLDAPLATVPGRPVDPARVPAGCAFAARCPLADAHCRVEDPQLVTSAPGARVACWHAGEPLPDPVAAPARDIEAVTPTSAVTQTSPTTQTNGVQVVV